MIDNVILLITGTLHERDTHELLERCHPLGVFDTMPALCVATNVDELYQSVLVETPLGTFCPEIFLNLWLCLSEGSEVLSPFRIICTHPARTCCLSMQTSRNRQQIFSVLCVTNLILSTSLSGPLDLRRYAKSGGFASGPASPLRTDCLQSKFHFEPATPCLHLFEGRANGSSQSNSISRSILRR